MATSAPTRSCSLAHTSPCCSPNMSGWLRGPCATSIRHPRSRAASSSFWAWRTAASRKRRPARCSRPDASLRASLPARYRASGCARSRLRAHLTPPPFRPKSRPSRGPFGLARCFAPAVFCRRFGKRPVGLPFRADRGGRGSSQLTSTFEDAMTKRAEAKYKIDRRMGQNIWGRPKSPVNRREYGPGQHGQRRKSKLSDFGVQLKAKQKLRGYYANISERQFRGIYQEAIRLKGDSGAHLIGLLERRLDAMIYRAKFVPTVFAARQFISHGHVKVNGKRVTVSSMRVKVNDMVEVKDKSRELA